jgi:hypothetical protein
MYQSSWLTPLAWLAFIVSVLVIVGLVIWRPEAIKAWFGHDREKPIEAIKRQQAREEADQVEVALDEAENRYQEIDEEVNTYTPQIARLLTNPKVTKSRRSTVAALFEDWKLARRGTDDEKLLEGLRSHRRYLKQAQVSLATECQADEWKSIIDNAKQAADNVKTKAKDREAALRRLMADLTADGESGQEK